MLQIGGGETGQLFLTHCLLMWLFYLFIYCELVQHLLAFHSDRKTPWFRENLKIPRVICLHHDNYDNDDDDFYLRNGWPTKDVWTYFQCVPLSEILTTTNLQYATRRIELAQDLILSFRATQAFFEFLNLTHMHP